ncbi:MAG: AAA family ATPase [Acidimicrobiia bacterium]|nr:AAA family ATPase [Acidimicrobiia bacterium]
MTCPSCGADVPSGARFCSACGRPVVARGEERRVVTVVFADIVGFTTLAELADPEHVKRTVDACFERLARDVTDFGGRVDKVVGDAIIALFGAPVAHEDDPERAVRAALRMQQTVAGPIAGVASPLQVRIGVNTGEVLVGALRAGGDYTAMGDVVNTAQRLQAAAEPGTVVVGPATYAATSERIAYEPLGSLRAKGREQEVPAHRAVEALLPPGHRPRRVGTPLVGRRSELSLCTEAVGMSIRHRRSAALVLLGEAGMGKSRLAIEVGCAAAGDHGAQVLEGRCVPYGEANVWWPVADAVRSACGIGADATADDARAATDTLVADLFGGTEDATTADRVVQGLLHVMGYAVALRDIDPQHAGGEARWALLTLCSALAARAPLVLSLSDVHWADPSVVELADDLLAHLAREPFVLIATARGDAPASLLTSRRSNVAVVHLDPLDRQAAAELLSAISASELPDGVADDLVDRSGGNPLFLEELAALLAESAESAGSVVGADRSGAELATDRAADTTVPDTLRGLVAARLDTLSAHERSVLEDAAVWGRSGPLEVLEHMGEGAHELDRSDVGAAVDQLVERDLLERDGSRWSFRSDLVREVAYATLTKTARAYLHCGIAWFLEQSHPTPADASDRATDVISHHYLTAAGLVAVLGPLDKLPDDLSARAVTWAAEAARRARVADHPAMAAQLYGRALDVGADDAGTEADLLRGRGDALVAAGDLAGGRAALERALELTAGLDEPGLRARVQVAHGELLQAEGHPSDAVEVLRDAIERFKEVDDAVGESDALRALSLTLMFSADNERAEEAVIEALARYQSYGDRRGEAWALQHLAWIAYVDGRDREADERLETSAAMFRELGDRGGMTWSLGLQAFVKFHRGDLAAARHLGDDVLRESAERGDRWGYGMMQLLGSSVRLWSGHAVDAVRTARAALETFESIVDGFGATQATIALARALVTSGQVDDGLRVLTEAAARIEQQPDSGARADASAAVAIGLANTQVQLGRPTEAVVTLDLLESSWRTHRGLGDVERVVARALAEVQLGSVTEARHRLERLVDAQPDAADSTFRSAAAALAAAAAGAEVDEVETLAEEVIGATRGTYLDRFTAQLAVTLVRCGRYGADELAGFDHLEQVVDATDDEVARAVLATARAEVLGHLGVPGGDRAAAEAEERWTLLGGEGGGWRTAARAVMAAGADRPGLVAGPSSGS